MTEIVVTDLFGDSRSIDATDGDSLMQAITGNGFDDMQARCGGNCKCCTCHIYVRADDAAKLPAMGDAEQALVSASPNFKAGESRLACQISVNGDLDGIAVEIVNEA